uniref:Peptidase S1 domain-containing protein n=1 Tax=Lepeophtheirus salmonis TaxID=72036 RepID=A0A0K2TUC9_LEPSM
METRENNIAIIYLKNKLVWNDKVLPICFSNNYFPIRDGQLATFSGSNFLSVETDSPYVHFSIVKKLNNRFNKDCQKNDLLCTKRNSVKNSLNEGGPLTICQDSKRCVLAGILSYIKEDVNLLVFTNISKHINWIEDHL